MFYKASKIQNANRDSLLFYNPKLDKFASIRVMLEKLVVILYNNGVLSSQVRLKTVLTSYFYFV